MIKFPYGRRDFVEIITEDYLYLDRTHYIPFMEDWGKELLFMRPRRFGKSLWLSTLMNYYDVAKEDDFERLFGHLEIGQEPTPLHNKYLVMRWDFSRVASHGTIEDIERSLNSHINSRIKRFLLFYNKELNTPIEIDEDNALVSFESLTAAVDISGHQLYLFIDEYDNFANEVMMASRTRLEEVNLLGGHRPEENQERYSRLVKGEGLFKTFFKNLKSAGSGDGLDRIFMTGVSPVVLNDVTSGANVFEDISWHPKVNELCGFTKAEVTLLAQQLVDTCEMPDFHIAQIIHLLENYYNGSRFVDDYSLDGISAADIPKVYNPTLTFYFLKDFQWKCSYPKHMIDQNLVPDDSKLAYIGQFKKGQALIEKALSKESTIAVETVRRKFNASDLFDSTMQEDSLAVLLCYLGALTSAADGPGNSVVLEIPNLVMRTLYAERILAQMVNEDNDKIAAGKQATGQLFTEGAIDPLCHFVEENLLSVYDNRDARHFNELTVKTLFMTLLYNNQLYLMESEPELEQRYGDLLMLVRPGMHNRGLVDLLIEFKYLPLNKVTREVDGKRQKMDGQAVKEADKSELKKLDSVKAELTDAKEQLESYRQTLLKKYAAKPNQGSLHLHTFAVVSVGMKRILWEEII
ncbi:MAG: AAA family ATPase [Chloroflexota bacterium]